MFVFASRIASAKVTASPADEALFKERASQRQEVQKLQKILADETKKLTDVVGEAAAEKKKLDAHKKEHEVEIMKLEKHLRLAWNKKLELDNIQAMSP